MHINIKIGLNIILRIIWRTSSPKYNNVDEFGRILAFQSKEKLRLILNFFSSKTIFIHILIYC